jgi:hypothetical protein
MTTPDNALHQAHAAAATYMEHGLRDLCAALDIDRGLKGWQEKLAPFAPVLAAMVTAAATDFETAMRVNHWGVTETKGETQPQTEG